MKKGSYSLVAVTPHGTFKRTRDRKLAAVSVWKDEGGRVEARFHVTRDTAPSLRQGWSLLGVYDVTSSAFTRFRDVGFGPRDERYADLETVLG
jgi:hypothetical protein